MLLNAAQCRVKLGIDSSATWTKWTKDPTFPPFIPGEGNNHTLYDPEKVKEWMTANGKKLDAATPPSLKEEHLKARIDKERELSKLAKLKREQAEGKLVAKSKVLKDNLEKFTYIRNRLSSLPSHLSPLLEGRSLPEIEEILESEITKILEVLSKDG